jgi:hypothetical protein
VYGVAADARFYIMMHGVDDSNIGQEHPCIRECFDRWSFEAKLALAYNNAR